MRQHPSTFRMLVSLCGLTLPEAAELTDQAPQTAKMKNSGRRRSTEYDIEVLLEIWRRIRTGETDGLPEGAVLMSRAMTLAEDVDAGRRTVASLVEGQFGSADPEAEPEPDPAEVAAEEPKDPEDA